MTSRTLRLVAAAWTTALVHALAACGSSSDSDGSGDASSGGGGTSSGGSGASSGGGGAGGASAGGSGGSADAGGCADLLADLDAKLAEAASCWAGTPNPSSCIIVEDGLCDCAAVKPGYEQPYLDAAKAVKAAGCQVACAGVVCPAQAVCAASAGSNQGKCQPAY